MRTSETNRLEIVDFVLGTLNAAEDIRPEFIMDSFDYSVDRGLEVAYIALDKLIETDEVDFDVRFRIKTDPIHGDSQNVYNTMSFLRTYDYVRPAYYSGVRFYRFNRGDYLTGVEFHNARYITGNFEIYRILGRTFLDIINPNN